MKDYKDTLLMMQTDFPMRANLNVKEPEIQKYWEEHQIYQKSLKKREGTPLFCLHDGPPYANGSIHIGHSMNKTLKDFLVRYWTMNGRYAPYQPGWDTHGLPIEAALTANKKINRKEMTVAEFRRACEEYALQQVAIQKAGFKRLGVFGDWDSSYLTLDRRFEATQLRCFGEIVRKGLIYKGLKPVYWSWSSETALAEAEIEYHDVTSPAIYLAMKVVDGLGVIENGTELVIWTTTPWTIPANLAICLGPKIEYTIVKTDKHPGRSFVIANELLKSVVEDLQWTSYENEGLIKGADLVGVKYQHPFLDRVSGVIVGDHVTLDTGTGLVHTAPGHGVDDFIVGRKYGLDTICPVDSRGIMTSEAGEYSGMFYEVCSKVIVEKLLETSEIIGHRQITHSYPHDWRTKKPIIFRATPQWFASIDKYRESILREISDVKWVPNWGEVRISNMIKDRDDWCISRQRVWGVPIPVFYAEDGTAILEPKLINHVADLVERHGSNYWFEVEAEQLLPEGYTHPNSPNGKFTKETDIMDVWFDSGTSCFSAMEKYFNHYPADVYLEGADQYRGWFNSSISIGVALKDKAPFKTVITHGFVLDGEGRKMSKSLGNVVDPLQICAEHGADILRLWVASTNYQADVRVNKDIINQNADGYRKIRNTFRFMLGSLFDFKRSDYISYDSRPLVDQVITCRYNEIVGLIHTAYQSYAFDEVYRLALNFMSNEFSSFYLDYTKDILYIEKANALSRRSIQSVIYDCLTGLARLLTPIIPHTTEEVYQYLPEMPESIYMTDMPVRENLADSDENLEILKNILLIRTDIYKVLEEARNQKLIGKSFSSQVVLVPTEEVKQFLDKTKLNLSQLLIISKFTIASSFTKGQFEQYCEAETPSGKVVVAPAEGHTCSRCRQVVKEVGEDELCDRCREVIS